MLRRVVIVCDMNFTHPVSERGLRLKKDNETETCFFVYYNLLGVQKYKYKNHLFAKKIVIRDNLKTRFSVKIPSKYENL